MQGFFTGGHSEFEFVAIRPLFAARVAPGSIYRVADKSGLIRGVPGSRLSRVSQPVTTCAPPFPPALFSAVSFPSRRKPPNWLNPTIWNFAMTFRHRHIFPPANRHRPGEYKKNQISDLFSIPSGIQQLLPEFVTCTNTLGLKQNVPSPGVALTPALFSLLPRQRD